MGNLKTGIWIVICGLVALLFFQNQEVFLAKQSFRIDLFFINYQTPELPDVLFFVCTFVVGYLISYFVNLSMRFKTKKLIRHLNAALDSQQKEITELKSELDGLKAAPQESVSEVSSTPDEQPVAPETPETQETPLALDITDNDVGDNLQEQTDKENEKRDTDT